MNSTIECIWANQDHIDWLLKNDLHVNHEVIREKVLARQIIIARSQGELLGWLRFGMFWDNLPFMNLLFVLEAHRNLGIGKKLVQFWEKQMLEAQHSLVMTSTQSNENAQHFYRSLSYKDAGSFILPKEALEIIFIKELSKLQL